MRIHPDLPIFMLSDETRSVLYVPGRAIAVAPEDGQAIQIGWMTGIWPLRDGPKRIAALLEIHARRAKEAWDARSRKPFAPECLTLYLSSHCNLACSYCYSTAHLEANSGPVLDLEAVGAGARMVAASCSRKNRPFHLVVHGGGEPTTHWRLLLDIVRETRLIARASGLEWWSYIATNGVISVEKARWLGRNFDMVGISCDGTEDIQDAQRPSRDGRGTSATVVRTAQAIRQVGGRFNVRTTITRRNVERQAEVVRYLNETLGATTIRFEPMYRVRGIGPKDLSSEDGESFVHHFLIARREARSRGCELIFQDARIEEIHGPFCDVQKDVLHLTPDGQVTGCFFWTQDLSSRFPCLNIGHYDRSVNTLTLYQDHIEQFRVRGSHIPERCIACVNIYHCSRECPEICHTLSAAESGNDRELSSIRCQIQRLLAEQFILEAVGCAGEPTP